MLLVEIPQNGVSIHFSRDSFDSSSSTGRLLKAIDHLNIIAQYSSDTTCHAGKSSKNGEVVESNGVECNVYVYPMQKWVFLILYNIFLLYPQDDIKLNF